MILIQLYLKSPLASLSCAKEGYRHVSHKLALHVDFISSEITPSTSTGEILVTSSQETYYRYVRIVCSYESWLGS